MTWAERRAKALATAEHLSGWGHVHLPGERNVGRVLLFGLRTATAYYRPGRYGHPSDLEAELAKRQKDQTMALPK